MTWLVVILALCAVAIGIEVWAERRDFAAAYHRIARSPRVEPSTQRRSRRPSEPRRAAVTGMDGGNSRDTQTAASESGGRRSSATRRSGKPPEQNTGLDSRRTETAGAMAPAARPYAAYLNRKECP